jgi:hypothetical protein
MTINILQALSQAKKDVQMDPQENEQLWNTIASKTFLVPVPPHKKKEFPMSISFLKRFFGLSKESQ